MSHLVIVESPAKAKTIEGYLGNKYKVASSYGHIRDLPKGNEAIDKENGFTPTYIISNDKKSVITELKKLVNKSDLVYLASDDDREGEAISWHLKEVLKLTDKQYKRIVFRSVTKSAVIEALENPRKINQELVDSQQARRILDRLVGFELSPVLWKKIQRGLSAGRVQSVAVKIIVEREREREKFDSTSSFKVVGNFLSEKNINIPFKGTLNQKIDNKEESIKYLESLKKAQYIVNEVNKKATTRSPFIPFTTSTLQQEASQKLGFSVSRTMSLAQKLYEKGLITYMRTDSVNFSKEAINEIENVVVSNYGKEFSKPRVFKNKSKNVQEAHEAIRPTNFNNISGGGDESEKKLYGLIWKRSLASQMSDAKIEITTAKIEANPSQKEYKGKELYFLAKGEVILFQGFLAVYDYKSKDSDDAKSKTLPPLQKNMALKIEELVAKELYSKPPARFSEATLVRRLEELGIGRPSTYAPTVSTIQKRGYVIKQKNQEGKNRDACIITLKNGIIQSTVKKENYDIDNNKLVPTNTALIVNDFLVKHFSNITDYNFTRNVEEELDKIADGGYKWAEMISQFYNKFHSTVIEAEKIERSQAGTIREIGVDSKTGNKVYGRLGKYGPYVQLGEIEGDTKPKYASLRQGQFLDKITLEEALTLFQLPRDIGEFEGSTMQAAIGRFGPYIKHNAKFVSIPKTLDPHDITENEAIELILAKRKADKEKFIKQFDENPEVQILKGRWGAYIKNGKKNIKIPKTVDDPSTLIYDDVLKIIEEASTKQKTRKFKK